MKNQKDSGNRNRLLALVLGILLVLSIGGTIAALSLSPEPRIMAPGPHYYYDNDKLE